MRAKEEAHDYRYFPDPDLLPLKVDSKWVEKVKKTLPELPLAKLHRFVNDYKIPEYDAAILTQTRPLAEFYEDVAESSKNPKSASNWIMGDLMRILNDQKKEISASPVSAKQLSDIIKDIDGGKISGKIGKTIFEQLATWKNGPSPSVEQIIKDQGLVQVTDTKAIEGAIDRIIAANMGQVEQYRAGKDKVFGFFVGQVMKEMKGQGAPQIINDILKKKLKGD
jgi:aspartyl-tRNA(Asn)/glutamyl-tRNA(Gln) amidotransferase subunit B